MEKIKNIYTEDIRLEHNTGADWNMDYYHFHNVYELYLVVTPGAEMWVGNKQYLLAPHDLLLLGTNDLHRSVIHDKRNYQRYILYFNPFYMASMNTGATNLLESFLRLRTGGSHRINLGEEKAARLTCMLEELGVLLKHTGYGADVRRKMQLALILLELEILTRPDASPGENAELTPPGYPLLKPVLDYVDAHYPEELSTEEIGRLFGFNRHQLNELFRQMTGLSFHQYLVQYRIVKAKELLETGNISTTEACLESGFRDYSHFIRTFKELVGLPPGKYANQAAAGKWQGNHR
jgi:AraC-like DNA-binding protein